MEKMIPVEYSNQRILLTSQLAERYGVTEKVISNNFNRNKDRYTEGKDFYCLEGEKLKTFKRDSSNLGIAENTNKLYLWTEHGALLHAKSLGTDKAWEIYGELVDTYFHARDRVKANLPDSIKQALADAKLFNARARVSSQWLKLADRVDIPEYKQVCAHYASGVLSGTPVIPLPETTERHLSATEIGALFGISAQKVGAIANREGLKTDDYGKWYHDKSSYSAKEVDTFKYNSKAVEQFRKLLHTG